jgi:uncharacterized protein YecT (DUF1311 family)
MMKILVMLAMVGLGCSSGFAQESAQYHACADSANTQDVLTRCASEEAKRVDAELNSVYRKLLASLSANRKAAAKVKAAQRAWVAYRNAYMDAMYPEKDKQSYGSIFPMEFNLFFAKLTRDQIAALRDLGENLNW